MSKTIFMLWIALASLWACQQNSAPATTPIPVLRAQTNSKLKSKAYAAANDSIRERRYSLQERELEYIMELWPGQYDNVEQLDFDMYVGKSSSELGQHLRVHHHASRLSQSAMGEYVIYIEEMINEDPKDIRRQSLYVLTPSDTSKLIQLSVFHFKKLMPLLSVGKTINHLNDLTESSPRLEPGCDMVLEREGMAFRAVAVDKFCQTDNADASKSIDYQFRIAKDEYWFEEIIYDRELKTRLPDKLQQSAYQLERAKCFVCMIDFPKEDGGRPVVTHHYVDIHDQGGAFEFEYRDGRTMVLGMRNTWSFGMQRETFVIFIQEGSQSGPTLIYSWGNPGADRIGFNPGWIRVQCDLDTAENRKLQHGLRPDS